MILITLNAADDYNLILHMLAMYYNYQCINIEFTYRVNATGWNIATHPQLAIQLANGIYPLMPLMCFCFSFLWHHHHIVHQCLWCPYSVRCVQCMSPLLLVFTVTIFGILQCFWLSTPSQSCIYHISCQVFTVFLVATSTVANVCVCTPLMDGASDAGSIDLWWCSNLSAGACLQCLWCLYGDFSGNCRLVSAVCSYVVSFQLNSQN